MIHLSSSYKYYSYWILSSTDIRKINFKFYRSACHGRLVLKEVYFVLINNSTIIFVFEHAWSFKENDSSLLASGIGYIYSMPTPI